MNKPIYDTKAKHKPIELGPNSCRLSSRIELKSLDTSTTKPGFFRPPTVALYTLSFFCRFAPLPRCGEYDRGSRISAPLPDPSDYRRLYLNTSAEVLARWGR